VVGFGNASQEAILSQRWWFLLAGHVEAILLRQILDLPDKAVRRKP
jgi:hypothetical protein